MNTTAHAQSETNVLIDEIALSFATLDADTPRETILPCPRCAGAVLAMNDQRAGMWELSCCGHAKQHASRSQALLQWNEWARPWQATSEPEPERGSV